MQLTSKHSTPEQMQMQKMISYIMVPLGLIFTSWLPAGLQFYFVTAGLTGLFQTAVIFNPAFRRWAGLTELPNPSTLPAPAATGGFMEQMKKSVRDAKKMAGEKMNDSSDSKKSQKAIADEERLQAEYYESLRERMAELEKKMKRRP